MPNKNKSEVKRGPGRPKGVFVPVNMPETTELLSIDDIHAANPHIKARLTITKAIKREEKAGRLALSKEYHLKGEGAGRPGFLYLNVAYKRQLAAKKGMETKRLKEIAAQTATVDVAPAAEPVTA